MAETRAVVVFPETFMGPFHAASLDAVRATFEAGQTETSLGLIDGVVCRLLDVARGAPKCGADLAALMAVRAVFLALAGQPVGQGDGDAWASMGTSRAVGAVIVQSGLRLGKPEHRDWLCAVKIARSEGLFRADPQPVRAPGKKRRGKIKLNKAKPRPAPEHQDVRAVAGTQFWERS